MKVAAILLVAGTSVIASAQALTPATIGQGGATHPLLVSAMARPDLFNSVETIGDTVGYAPMVQDGINAFFLDTAAAPGTATIAADPGVVTPTGGGNALYAAGTSTGFVYTREVVISPTQLFVQVNYFSLNSAGAVQVWVPSTATTSPNGVPFNSWRLDVGALAAGTNDIDLVAPIASVLQSGQTGWSSTGTNYGTFALTVNNAAVGGTGIGGVGVIGLGGGSVAGFDWAEHALFWEVTLVPAPGAAALLGLGGLVATRRRR